MNPLPRRKKETRRDRRRRERREEKKAKDETTLRRTQKKKKKKKVGFEYLPHTADVQLHSWGENIEQAFEQVTVAMFGYMTELDRIDIERKEIVQVEGGTDLKSLLYKLMDEFLYLFCTENFVVREVKIIEFDRKNLSIRAQGMGETFKLSKHPQGTEVKAITYSAMQIHERIECVDVFVVIDI